MIMKALSLFAFAFALVLGACIGGEPTDSSPAEIVKAVPTSPCGDLLQVWLGNVPGPVPVGSQNSQRLLTRLQTCVATYCSGSCSGSLYATPPTPLNGSPGAGVCKLCIITNCQPHWDACLSDP